MVDEIRPIDNVNIFRFLSTDGTIRELKSDDNSDEFIVIWLDEKINTSADCIITQRQLRDIVKYLKVFTDENTCLDHLINNDIKNQKMFCIISGLLADRMISYLSKLPQIVYIYIFCQSASDRIPTEDKVRGTFIDKHGLFATIIQDIRQIINNTTEMSLFSSPTAREQSVFTGENEDFKDFQNFLNVIINNDYNDALSKEEMIKQCRCYYRENKYEQQKIDEFEANYISKDAIQWYTRDSFIYRLLNKALRTMNVEIIYAFRYFIGDLCRQIHNLHWEQVQGAPKKLSTLYHGQILPTAELENLKQHIGEEISWNSFLSTSRSCETAYIYSGQGKRPVGFESVIFQIDLITNEPNPLMPFCSIEHISHFQEEDEYLFKVGTVFRLISMEDYDICWLIQIQLTNVSDHLVNKIHETTKNVLSDFFKTSSTNDAQTDNIDQIIDEIPIRYRDLMAGYINIGNAYKKDFDYVEQFKCYKKALEVYENIPLKNQSLLQFGYRTITTRLSGYLHDCATALDDTTIDNLSFHRRHNCFVKKSLEYYEKIRDSYENSICSNYHHLIVLPENPQHMFFSYNPGTNLDTLEQNLDNLNMHLNEWYCSQSSEKKLKPNFRTGDELNMYFPTVFINYRESENKLSETVTYKVDTLTTVNTFLKNVCSSVGWIYKWRLQLVHNGHELRKTAILADYDIQDNAYLIINQEDIQIPPDMFDAIRETSGSIEKHFIRVYVRVLNGPMMPISLSLNEDVLQLKYRIYDYSNIAIERQRLIYCSKQLEESRTLSYYNVKHDAIINMRTRHEVRYRDQRILLSIMDDESKRAVVEKVCTALKALEEVRESDKTTSLETKLCALTNLYHKFREILQWSEACHISLNYCFFVFRLLRAKMKSYERQLESLGEKP